MKILIVGAGIGGLTLAAFLKGSNVEYEIIERYPDWRHQGYSINLWNNGRNILKKLGLAEVFDANSRPIHAYFIYDGKGRLLRRYNFADFYDRYGLALDPKIVDRRDLHAWLISRVDAAKITMDISVDSIADSADKVKVSFTNGITKEYDAVVGADGIHSRVRELIFSERPKASRSWRIWYMWVPNRFRVEKTVTEFIAPGAFIALFDGGEKTLAIMAATVRGASSDDPNGRLDRLKRSFTGISALAPQIFDALRDGDINPADVMHVRLKKWVHGHVALLGDAAHGFEPHAGIGGSMALEDGYVLAGELTRVSDKYSLHQALNNYEFERKRRVDVASRLTSKMKIWALVRSRLLRKTVDLIAPYFPEKYFVKDYHALLKEDI